MIFPYPADGRIWMESDANGIEMESGIIVSPIILAHKKIVTNSKSNLFIFLFRNMKLRVIIIFLIVI